MKRKTSFNIYFTKIILFVLFFILSTQCYSQNPHKTYRIFLKDKGPYKFEEGSPLYDSTIKIHSKIAIERRLKVRNENEILTIEDAPIYEYYVETIASLGAKIILKLRWDNYIVVSCDSNTLNIIQNFPFVKSIQPTSAKLKILSNNIIVEKETKLLKQILNDEFYNCDFFDYGDSFNQNNIINVIPLHSMGITGLNVIIGLIDTGFNTKIHKALSKTTIVEEKDFIFNDSIVSNDYLDTTDQEGHGTIVLSTISGYEPGNLIGIAPSASFLLAKTEFLPTETHLEEDNYAAAVEWLESRGADVISSSLGYFYFDTTEEKYSYSELDGNSTIVSRAVNKAVARGVVFITAAGNSGPNEKTLNSPADADSVIAVAAVTELKEIPDFTSRGPRGDGQQKPDIASMGVQVVCAPPQWSSGVIKVNGTSLATPQIAGAVALILSSFPELTPFNIRTSLLSTASNSSNPNNKIGYGIANTFLSAQQNGIIISPLISYRIKQFQRIAFYIVSNSHNLDIWLYIKFFSKIDFARFKFNKSSTENLYVVDIPLDLFQDSTAIGYIIANDMSAEEKYSTRRYPYKSSDFFTIQPNSTVIPCGVKNNELPKMDDTKTNAFIYPSLLTNNDYQSVINIPLDVESDINIKIYNNLGQNIFNYNEKQRNSGIANIPIKILNMASGIYFAVIQYDKTTETLTFIISR